MNKQEEIQTYKLNCDKCGDVFESSGGFPDPHICKKCSKGEGIREVIDLYTDDCCLYPDRSCNALGSGYCSWGEGAYKCLMERLGKIGVVIKDRCCGVSHQDVWVKIYSVRSIIDGEVELFDGYGTKGEKDGDNEMS